MSKETLLQKAKKIPSIRRKPIQITKEKLEVIIAYLKGDIAGNQFCNVLPEMTSVKNPNYSQILSMVKRSCEEGIITIKIN